MPTSKGETGTAGRRPSEEGMLAANISRFRDNTLSELGFTPRRKSRHSPWLSDSWEVLCATILPVLTDTDAANRIVTVRRL